MRRIILSIGAALLSFGFALASLAAAYARLALVLFRPEPLRFATGTPSIPMSIDGQSLDRSLLSSMRHESGMSRRAAPRSI